MTHRIISFLLILFLASLGLQANSVTPISGSCYDMPAVPLKYTPMLEVGKEWRYALYDHTIYGDRRPDRLNVLKIVEKIEWNGKELFRLQSFTDGSTEADKEVYLWEDCENRKVWEISGFGSTLGEFEKCLYDFNNLLDGEVTGVIFYSEPRECKYVAIDGVHRAFRVDDGSEMLVEGFGVFSFSETGEGFQVYGDLFSYLGYGCSGNCGYIPRLYEIVNGCGETIYVFDSGRPGASVEAPGFTETAITVSDGDLEVISVKEIGDVMIVSATGATVFNGYVADTRFVFMTDHLLPGVYILHTNGNTRKFIVR